MNGRCQDLLDLPCKAQDPLPLLARQVALPHQLREHLLLL